MKKFLLILLIVLAVLVIGAGLFVGITNHNVYKTERPLTDEGAKELRDSIIPPQNMVIPDEVKILGLGEYSHGNQRTQTLRRDIAEVMYRAGDLKALVLEMPYVDGLKIDRFIHGQDTPDLDQIMGDFDFFLYQTEEMKDLFLWLKDMNEQGADLHFYGMDTQEWDRARDELNQTLEKFGIAERLDTPDATQLASVKEELLRQDLGEDEINILLNLKVLAQHIDYKATLDKAAYQSYSLDSAIFRDRAMGENTLWIQEQLQGRILLMGHNGHIRKTPDNWPTAGTVIADAIGEGYYAIGTLPGQTELKAIDTGWSGQASDFQKIKTFKLTNRADLGKAFSGLDHEAFLPLENVPSKLRDFLDQPHRLLSIGASLGKIQKIFAGGLYENLNPLEAFDALYYIPLDKPYTFTETAYYKN